MRRDSLKTIGFVLLFVVIAVLVICFDDIKAMVNEVMMEQTQITNAAMEPEIVDLAKCLNKMGAKIEGAGTKKKTVTLMFPVTKANSESG